LFHLFDVNGDGHIDFLELVEALNILVFGTTQQRYRFFFRLYDLHDHGYITRAELVKMFHAFLTGLSEEKVQQQVNVILSESDENHDAKISFEEFMKMARHPEVNLNATGGFNKNFAGVFGIRNDLPEFHDVHF